MPMIEDKGYSVNKFRNGSNMRLMKSLFYEMHAEHDYTLYTLKEKDHEGYPSFQRLYLELNDPTEYLVATTLIDGVEHWDMLCSALWFQPHLDRMRKTMRMRLESEAMTILRADAQDPKSKTAKSSARFVLQFGLDKSAPARRGAGRPSKHEVQAYTKEQSEYKNSVEDDFERVSNVIKIPLRSFEA